MAQEQFLSPGSVAGLRRLIGREIYTIFAPNLDAAGSHLAAWTLSMLLEKDRFLNFSCEWSETPYFLNDSWQITVAEGQSPLNIAKNESGALISPCTINLYGAKPITKIEIFSRSNISANEGIEETVNYDQAIVFQCEEGRAFCIGCLLNGPGIATYLHFSENREVIAAIVAESSVRLVVE